jgi:hypothetical protein
MDGNKEMEMMKKFALGLLVALALMVLPAHEASAQTSVTAASSSCLSLLVPSYVYPNASGSAWNRAIADSPWNPKTVRTMVMNPNSGPGASFSADYASIIKKVKLAGGKTEGYVWTNYGAVPLTEVEKQVDQYISWYGTDALSGIFVDTMSSDGSLIEGYYQPLLTYITTKLPKATVTFNPGTYPHPKYAAMKTATATSSFDLIVYEHDFVTFTQEASAAPAWVLKYPASKFIGIVYETSEDQLPEALKLAAQRNMASVFITDDVMPNPYRGLPTYWKKLVSLTQAGCQ